MIDMRIEAFLLFSDYRAKIDSMCKFLYARKEIVNVQNVTRFG